MRKILLTLWRILTFPFWLVWSTLRLVGRFIGRISNDIRELLTEEPEDEPLADTIQKTVENPGGLMEHVDALRRNIFRALAGLALTTAVSFLYTRQLIDLLAKPVGGIQALVAIDPTEPVGVYMRVALLSGFTLALPYIAFELWLFIAPGISRSARLFSLAAIPVATLFFIGGMAFTYFVMLPAAIPFLVNFIFGMTVELRPASYVRFVTSVMFWIGISFEFPLIIYVLARIGLVRARVLAQQWRLAVVIIALLAAIITPTIDPVNMALVMGPLIILYFISIGLAYLARREKAEPA